MIIMIIKYHQSNPPDVVPDHLVSLLSLSGSLSPQLLLATYSDTNPSVIPEHNRIISGIVLLKVIIN